MPTRKTPFTFHLEDEILSKIKIIAKAENRSICNLLEYLCIACIRNYEETNGIIIVEL